MPAYTQAPNYAFTESIAHASADRRMAFIRKVYLFFASTLLFAIGGASVALQNPQILESVLKSGMLLWIGLFLFAMFGMTLVRKVPVLNVVALFAFGVMIGLMASPILFYAQLRAPGTITQAFVLTSAIFIGLTSYVLISRRDFSWMMGGLFVGFFILLGATFLFFWFPPSSGLYFAIQIAAALLFSGFILARTSAILHHYAEDEYIMAAFGLFLDFYNLFITILNLLSLSRD
jgi:FtsH-binding integral membrane protein